VRQLVIKSVQHYLMHGVTVKFTLYYSRLILIQPTQPNARTGSITVKGDTESMDEQ